MRGFDTTDYFKYSIQQIEDLYVRDELYKREIDSKVRISQNDIQKALNRSSKSLSVRIISTYDSSSVFNYYNLLLKGAPFDSIGRISDPVEYDSNKAPIKITYGQMQDDHVEDVLYSLKTGQFSAPIKSGNIWFIFKIAGVNSQVPHNAHDPNYNRAITNIIRMRKSRIIGVKYLNKFYKNKKATVDSTLFLKLAGEISSVLIKKEASHNFGRDNKLFLDEGSIIKILDDFRNIQDDEIVHLEKNPIKLKEYLYSLVIYPLLIKDASFKSVAYNLMENLNKYIQYKFLSEKGYEEGFQNIPDVKEEIDIWRDDFLAKMFRNTFHDSIHVTNEDVNKYYKAHKGIEKVNLLEIINDNLDIIETVFKELKAGKDFRSLAEKYAQSSWLKSRGCETGYLIASSFGKIGEAAEKLKLNEMYGPIKTDSGYAVIKLIGRKIDSTKTNEDFNIEKDDIKDELLAKEFNQKFFKYIAELAEKYKYSINKEKLKNIRVMDIPMFTYKYIGFGGRIAAMPFLDAWYDWVKYINNKSNIIP